MYYVDDVDDVDVVDVVDEQGLQERAETDSAAPSQSWARVG